MKNCARLFPCLIVGIWMLTPGCAHHPGDKAGVALSNSTPLRLGERVIIEFISAGLPGSRPPSYQIDPQGFVSIDSVSIEIAGLTPTEAASKIHDTVSPRFYRELEVRVSRVQPDGAPNRSQPVGLDTNRASTAAGSGR